MKLIRIEIRLHTYIYEMRKKLNVEQSIVDMNVERQQQNRELEFSGCPV